MSIRKYLDWRNYFEGLYLNWIKTVTTTISTWFITNGAEVATGFKLGLTWQQALGQLAFLTFYEVNSYIKNKPKPDVIEKEE